MLYRAAFTQNSAHGRSGARPCMRLPQRCGCKSPAICRWDREPPRSAGPHIHTHTDTHTDADKHRQLYRETRRGVVKSPPGLAGPAPPSERHGAPAGTRPVPPDTGRAPPDTAAGRGSQLPCCWSHRRRQLYVPGNIVFELPWKGLNVHE